MTTKNRAVLSAQLPYGLVVYLFGIYIHLANYFEPECMKTRTGAFSKKIGKLFVIVPNISLANPFLCSCRLN